MSTSLPRRPGPTQRDRVVEWRTGDPVAREDRLATEEPLEIRLEAPGVPARRLAVTMRTPGNDFELAAGWVVHERIADPEALRGVRYCTDVSLTPEQEFNVVTVELDGPPLRLPEARAISSACGVCGAQSVEESIGGTPNRPPVRLAAGVVQALPQRLRDAQPGFGRTGALHAAGLFSPGGHAVAVREDVGRHNAVDKVVGSRLLAGEPVPPVLVLSGRIAFELVSKATLSGISVVVAVGAPTTLAVRLARQAGMTLVGFTSPERCVVYAGELDP